MIVRFCAVIAIGLWLALGAAADEEATVPALAVGDTLGSLSFVDQHGDTHVLDGSVRAVLFTRDMDAGDALKAALVEAGKERLGAAGAVYIADVSGMPGIIRRIFAEPAMRKRPYAMLLDRDGDLTTHFPSREGDVTLLGLENLRVARIDYLTGEAAIASALDAMAATENGADATP